MTQQAPAVTARIDPLVPKITPMWHNAPNTQGGPGLGQLIDVANAVRRTEGDS